MPFIEKERYQFPNKCRLHPDHNLYRDQEQHKSHLDINEWRCGYCRKSFYEEKYLDQHFDNRHYDLLNVVSGPKFVTSFNQSIALSTLPHPDIYITIIRKISSFRALDKSISAEYYLIKINKDHIYLIIHVRDLSRSKT